MFRITNSIKLVLAGLAFVVATACLPSQGSAQNVEAYLRKADLNDDGKIVPNEMTAPIKRYLTRKGYDVAKQHQIDDIVKSLSEKKKKASKTAATSTAAAKEKLKVPKFGSEPKAKAGVATFGAAATEPVEYSAAVTSRTQNTFDRYDVNSNGTIEGSEIENVPWGDPRPSVSDKNGDGRLSFQEIQERFRERETAIQRSRQSSSDDDQGRNRASRSNGLNRRQGRFNRSGNDSRYNRGRSRSSRDDEDEDDEDEEDEEDERSSRAYRSSYSRSNSSNKIKQFGKVTSYFKTHDLDRNGVIEGDEMKKVTSSSRTRYDENGDGKITKAEAYATVKSSPKSKGVTQKKSYSKNSSAFNKADANKDRLVQMHEFSKTWTKKKLDEFKRKDANGDSVISPDEW